MENSIVDKNTSLAAILEDGEVSRHLRVFFPEIMLDCVPAAMRQLPLSQLERDVVMPWGAPFPAGLLLQAVSLIRDCITDRKYEFIPLWQEEEKRRTMMASYPPFIPQNIGDGKESVCLISTNTRTDALRPAAIICPGGGYTLLSVLEEGLRFAEELEKNGIRPFILLYSLMPNRYPAPQLDLALAVQYVRTHASELGILPDDLMVMGSSAGGHLASVYAGNAAYYAGMAADSYAAAGFGKLPAVQAVPEKLCLNYPVITISGSTTVTPEEIGTPEALKETCREFISVRTAVSEKYPKTYVWACDDDPMVHADNARGLHLALAAAGAEHRYHGYPGGGHGIGMAEGTSAEGWFSEMLDYLYPDRSDPEGYFARRVADGTYLIGCDYSDFGGRSGKGIEFGMPTGNSWMIVGDKEALLVDTAAKIPGLRAFAEKVAGVPVRLILSHAHPDHVYRLQEFDAVMLHADDIPLLHGAYGWEPCRTVPDTVLTVKDGEILDPGNGHRVRVIHFPGHTDGSILLYDEKTRMLVSGDSIGRRLIYASCGYYPMKDFDSRLAKVEEMDIRGICSCHDRRIIDKEQIAFMRSALEKLPYAKDVIQYGDAEPMHYMRVGNEMEMRFFDCSYMEHQAENIARERDC